MLGGLSFAALGIAMSTLIPNQQAAGSVISTVFFVLLFLFGPWSPLRAYLLIVVIWGAVGAVIALRRFQWAPRRT